jgi:uncharacterized membrane protein YGL010W
MMHGTSPWPRFDFELTPSLSTTMCPTGASNQAGAPGFSWNRLAAAADTKRGDERRMNSFFRRQLTDYVEYHRDPWNCMMHVFGIVFLFSAAVLPLSLWSITVFGIPTSAATVAVVPVLVYWFLLDAALGASILAAAVILLSIAAMIAGHATLLALWSLTAVLIVVGVASQIIGHRVFERRQPALVDNPTHLLLGPMFVMAKLFIAFGFRHDLAIVIQQRPQSPSSFPQPRQPEPRPHA